MPPSFNVIGTAVGFLLGFTIALLWQNYSNALRLSLEEASTFYLILDSIEVLSPQTQGKFIPAVQNYLTILTDTEWPAMRLGLGTSEAWDAFHNIIQVMRGITPSPDEASAYASIMKYLDTVAINRLARLQTVDPILSIELFSVIIAGACFIVFSVAAHNPPNQHHHVITIGAVCLLLAFNIGLALVLTYPFSGSYGIKAKALLEGIPARLKQIERDNNKKLYAERFGSKPAEVKTEEVKKEPEQKPSPKKSNSKKK
jgi:hypothetical protein